MIDWKIGCSGFHYREWKNNFYPQGLAAGKWLQFYCEHFNSLESNVTFYRTPALSTLAKWYSSTPEHFIFSVKAPRIITHYKKFNAVTQDLQAFYSIMQTGLKEKLGSVLFQFPPSFSYTPDRLKNIIDNMDRSFINVVEFRHQSWWQQDVYDELKNSKIIFCSISYPGLTDTVIDSGDTAYLRFHGVPDLYYSSYEREYIFNIYSQINKIPALKKVFIYFNNTASMAAIDNAKYFQDLIK